MLGGVILAAGLLLLVLPTVDAPHSLAHEVSAVNTLRIIITLQNQYAAAQADRGFACELPTLKPVGQPEAPYSLEFLTTGAQSGYRFLLANCRSEANRARIHYEVTAAPGQKRHHRRSGFLH